MSDKFGYVALPIAPPKEQNVPNPQTIPAASERCAALRWACSIYAVAPIFSALMVIGVLVVLAACGLF